MLTRTQKTQKAEIKVRQGLDVQTQKMPSQKNPKKTTTGNVRLSFLITQRQRRGLSTITDKVMTATYDTQKETITNPQWFQD